MTIFEEKEKSGQFIQNILFSFGELISIQCCQLRKGFGTLSQMTYLLELVLNLKA